MFWNDVAPIEKWVRTAGKVLYRLKNDEQAEILDESADIDQNDDEPAEICSETPENELEWPKWEVAARIGAGVAGSKQELHRESGNNREQLERLSEPLRTTAKLPREGPRDREWHREAPRMMRTTENFEIGREPQKPTERGLRNPQRRMRTTENTREGHESHWTTEKQLHSNETPRGNQEATENHQTKQNPTRWHYSNPESFKQRKIEQDLIPCCA